MKILIVEDDRVLSLMLSRMVQRLGHELVNSVTMGEEAIVTVKKNEVDLILMDIMLEGKIDGIDAMKKIRENNDVPVIYVTGNSDKTTIERAKETAFVAYLVKPIVFDQLKKSIDKIT
ncbi:response regulator [Aliifodinibius sp. S!AR15-10]|uniref:response regulator n=1 Tax=Aliifodinibius sp. S!AR15-10 TaxID=2950437 RepID=UPI00285B3056|nr:response regulator [Aliifodinibius sp. S!AR15-10]MDR8390943.1 response regulator [Aliifodinibius sp. S!AR15-10]